MGEPNIYSKKDLVRLTSEPLGMQYQRIIAKVAEAYALTHGDIAICFSGGKDSALIADVYCEWLAINNLTHVPVRLVWANTTNETAAMKQYIKWFVDWLENKYGVSVELIEVKPANNQTFATVMKNEGLPFVSKLVASILRKVSKDMEAHGVTYDDVKDLHCANVQCRDALREMNLSDTTVLAFTGWSCNIQDFGREFVLAKRWMPLLDIKRVTGENLFFSEKCCSILKKDPMNRLNYSNIMTGEQATESKVREAAWLQHGCNFTFPDGSVKSKPLGAVSQDAVLYALKFRNTPICTDYGEIVECEKKTSDNRLQRCLMCTESQRTGCALCGFGIAKDPKRFVRLQEKEPAKIAFAFKPISKGGLGYKETCEYLNEYCKTNISIPEV